MHDSYMAGKPPAWGESEVKKSQFSMPFLPEGKFDGRKNAAEKDSKPHGRQIRNGAGRTTIELP